MQARLRHAWHVVQSADETADQASLRHGGVAGQSKDGGGHGTAGAGVARAAGAARDPGAAAQTRL
ncbi:hypothetical protein X946_4775 [Burkholderia sp. ABCPW 111]|nr:hypothetical protein X946_4775 [Burkholderia sp. ABCPW 111]